MSADRGDASRDHYADLPRLAQRELIRRAVLRPVGSALVLVVLYFVMPMEDLGSMTAIGGLVASLLLIAVVFTWQVRRILRARYPGVQAIEALAIAVPTYLLAFAATFHLMSVSTVANFSEFLSRLDALYFTLVCFSTVGFGDVVPHSEAARAVVSVQIVGNLLLIAAGVRVVTLAVQEGRRRRDG